MKILVTGSSGLIGGQAVEFFSARGDEVFGLDNNMRRQFFGPEADTEWNRNRLERKCKRFVHIAIDIRNPTQVCRVFLENAPFDAVIHCAGQPSHDWSAQDPRTDFAVNATGTLNMLEATRKLSPAAHFIFTSTNKVYGTVPNELRFTEFPTRYDLFTELDEPRWLGFNESTPIDRTTHSIFGASKLAADVMTQEYGRYFGLRTTVFRCGCLTGPTHSAVQLHGFLSYLVKCILRGKPYTVLGFKGKQVRDNLHSHDLVNAFAHVICNYNAKPGEVYNLGGGRKNSISVLEAMALIVKLCGKTLTYTLKDTPRIGDHQCWITDNGKFERDYPEWYVSIDLEPMLRGMIDAERTVVKTTDGDLAIR